MIPINKAVIPPQLPKNNPITLTVEPLFKTISRRTSSGTDFLSSIGAAALINNGIYDPSKI